MYRTSMALPLSLTQVMYVLISLTYFKDTSDIVAIHLQIKKARLVDETDETKISKFVQLCLD